MSAINAPIKRYIANTILMRLTISIKIKLPWLYELH